MWTIWDFQYVHSRDQLYWMTKCVSKCGIFCIFILLPVFCLHFKTKSLVNSKGIVGLLKSLIPLQSEVVMGKWIAKCSASRLIYWVWNLSRIDSQSWVPFWTWSLGISCKCKVLSLIAESAFQFMAFLEGN